MCVHACVCVYVFVLNWHRDSSAMLVSSPITSPETGH